MSEETNINERCRYLESYGFECNHLDQYVTMNGHGTFDFSNVPLHPESIIQHVINSVYELAYSNGRKDFQRELKRLLGELQ